MKSKGIVKVIRIHLLGIMNDKISWQSSQYVDRYINRATIPRATLLAWLKEDMHIGISYRYCILNRIVIV